MPEQNKAFATLRRFIPARAPVERCELCGAELAVDHQHLIEPASRKLLCACGACALLFSGPAGKYRRVPQRIRALPDFQLSEAQWESLLIPINMAFFFHSSTAGRVVALYPSPAGATESLLALEAWEEIVRQNPVLRGLTPDVEALLVNRLGRANTTGKAEYLLVPIDECYRLTGLLRARWRGLSGGAEVWAEIEQFFAGLRARAIVVKEAARA
ncbi:MAG: hypothetical protein HYR56_13745 [Acidobacteria bacterium]|nr:hypothetical protein [Acidobacteriota bacterium]MBI3423964.1 hypothetical protein [Acidobacteriota bacterium]